MFGIRQIQLSKLGWQIALLTRKLWLRATLISLLAVGAALISLFLSPYLPAGLSAEIGADAVELILNIIATSMLAVTTFSLSATVSAYSAATNNVTPRATRLLLEDRTTLNVLATFVGSFLYSVVAIITLATGLYGERGRVVLFAVTILVVILIVGTLLRWIDYLLRLGRVTETAKHVEQATTAAMRTRRQRPNLGGTPWDTPETLPDNAQPVHSNHIGYVQHVDVGAISHEAARVDARIYLGALPGTFADLNKPIAWVAGAKGDIDLSAIASAFTIGDVRSFDQDPRFGLCVMAEIASRALSPGLNDPGTAIEVIGRGLRVLSIWATEDESAEEPAYPHVHVPSIRISDVFDDLFAPIARDGAAVAEVQIRLQKAYGALARTGDERFREEAVRYSEIGLERAQAAMTAKYDLERVRAAAKDVAPDAKRGAKTPRKGKRS